MVDKVVLADVGAIAFLGDIILGSDMLALLTAGELTSGYLLGRTATS